MRYRVPLSLLTFLLLVLPWVPTHGSSIAWTLSFSDDFNGTSIDTSSWSLYGKNGPKGSHCWDDQNVTVADGQATLAVLPGTQCGGYSAAGMCACPVTTQTYGKYEIRMKATVGNSKIVALLWGANEWPPEIDFAEFPADGDGALRQRFTETLHYTSQNLMIHTHTDVDMTQWHTVGVEWSPGVISYTVDGNVTDTITDHVPSEPMWMGIQTQGSADATAAYTYIDWVHVYTYGGMSQSDSISDGFGQAFTGGWGATDQGATWVTTGGSPSDYSTDGSAGTMLLTEANVPRLAYLPQGWTTTDFLFRVSFDRKPGTRRVVAYGVAQFDPSSGAFYGLRLALLSNGTLRLAGVKTPPSGRVGQIGGEVNLGAIGAANTWYWLRGHVGSDGMVEGRVWKDGDPEPTTWQFSYLDTATPITAGGSPGLRAVVRATDTPYSVSFDDFSASTSS